MKETVLNFIQNTSACRVIAIDTKENLKVCLIKFETNNIFEKIG